tara:strand:- start:51259 stop:51798 length:540 start_codon:yes stop_codon:yes gene_type:complete
MIDQISNAIAEMAKAAAARLAVFAAIALVILTGIGFLIAAIFMYLAAQFGALGAALGLGSVFVALGLVALAIMLQKDPSDAIDQPIAGEHGTKRREDDVLLDMVIHAAKAGFATGQGDKARMQNGFDQLVTDFSDLGLFEPRERRDASDAGDDFTDRAADDPGDQPDENPIDPNAKRAG